MINSPSTERTTLRLQRYLDRWHDGDEAARNELLAAACDRLSHLARKMLKAERRLLRWVRPSDVFQNALLRLQRALQEVRPVSLLEFYRLAAVQIRRELIDLARHYYGPEGPAAREENEIRRVGPAPLPEPVDCRDEPSQLACWCEFHEQIEKLPEDQREVFDLVWYQGLTHAEAADLLHVCTKTVQRRWQAACLKLYQVLEGDLPEV
jgi:RNA polymerase sigma-70 factor (ECF subfamily)